MALVKPKNIRQQIRADIAHAKFPFTKRLEVEKVVVRGVRQFRVYRRRIGLNVLRPEDLRRRRGRGRPAEMMLRAQLIASLFRAWLIGFLSYPKINNKMDPPTPFVKFATVILQREGVGKISDHLEEFRAYRKKLLMASGFKVVRGVVN